MYRNNDRFNWGSVTHRALLRDSQATWVVADRSVFNEAASPNGICRFGCHLGILVCQKGESLFVLGGSSRKTFQQPRKRCNALLRKFWRARVLVLALHRSCERWNC